MYIFIGVFLFIVINIITLKFFSKKILSEIRDSDYLVVGLFLMLYVLAAIFIVICWPFALIIGGIFALAFGIKHLVDKTGE